MAAYRNMDEDELYNREGLSPRQYLEFTERERPPPQNNTEEVQFNYISSPGEPGPRGPPGNIAYYYIAQACFVNNLL